MQLAGQVAVAQVAQVGQADHFALLVLEFAQALVQGPGLADELLFGRLTEGGRLTVDLVTKTGEDGKEVQEVDLDIQPLPKKEGKPRAAEEAAAAD